MAGGIIGAPDPQDMAAPALPGIQGAPPAAAASPSQPQAPGQGQPALGAPQGGIAQGTGNTKGEVATPDVKPEYDAKKLAKAQTTLDVLNAMRPASLTDYMDRWEKQHGDIDDKYDNLKQQMGARPSDDEPQTKKEKFAALLEFGLHLMKNSAPATTNQGAVLADTISGQHDANKAAALKKQTDYDTQASGIESARQEEQKGIGTPAAAMKEQAGENREDAQNLKDTASAFKSVSDATTTKASALGAPTYATGPGGVIHAIVRDADGVAHAQPVTGVDGKPFVGKVLGREAGSGIDKSNQDPASVRTHKYLTNVLHLDPKVAEAVAFKEKTGNPDADHASVYKSVLSATFGDADKAKRVADQYILDKYGAGAVGRQNQALGPGMPPQQALQGLKPGMVRDFGANGKWTIGVDGKPTRVSGGPQSIQ